jgi:hypothetical protein
LGALLLLSIGLFARVLRILRKMRLMSKLEGFVTIELVIHNLMLLFSDNLAG